MWRSKELCFNPLNKIYFLHQSTMFVSIAEPNIYPQTTEEDNKDSYFRTIK